MSNIETVMVTGGAGYVGGILVPKLLEKGYRVKVYDLYIYGESVFEDIRPNDNLVEIKGDLRDIESFSNAVDGCDHVIHLGCISNDPSCDLDSGLAKSVNYDSFPGQVEACKKAGVKKFVFASSSSVYGISDEPRVTEDHPRIPVSDYNRFKAKCEDILEEACDENFTYTIIRPATICGYSPRLRLDLTVNILTNHAINNGKITVFGGTQYRPNLHIQDVTDLYCELLVLPQEKIGGKIYNAGYQNQTVMSIAEIVKKVVEARTGKPDSISIVTTPTDDNRSYRITCDKIKNEIGFEPKYTIEDAVAELCDAFEAGRIPNSLDDSQYFNIKKMQEIGME